MKPIILRTRTSTDECIGTLIGPECEYIWTGSGPIYENNQLIRREKKN